MASGVIWPKPGASTCSPAHPGEGQHGRATELPCLDGLHEPLLACCRRVPGCLLARHWLEAASVGGRMLGVRSRLGCASDGTYGGPCNAQGAWWAVRTPAQRERADVAAPHLLWAGRVRSAAAVRLPCCAAREGAASCHPPLPAGDVRAACAARRAGRLALSASVHMAGPVLSSARPLPRAPRTCCCRCCYCCRRRALCLGHALHPGSSSRGSGDQALLLLCPTLLAGPGGWRAGGWRQREGLQRRT